MLFIGQGNFRANNQQFDRRPQNQNQSSNMNNSDMFQRRGPAGGNNRASGGGGGGGGFGNDNYGQSFPPLGAGMAR